MMLEEEDESHGTSNEKQGEDMDNGGRKGSEIGGLSTADVTPAEVVAALSEYLPHSKDKSPKRRRGRPRKALQLERVEQRAKDVPEAGSLHPESGILKTSPTSAQKKNTDSERALENGSLKGVADQEQELTSPESGGTALLIPDICPPFSDTKYHTKSNTETHSIERAVAGSCRGKDGCLREGEGNCLVPPIPWGSNRTVEEDFKTENAAVLNPTARQLQHSWKKPWQRQNKERVRGEKQQEEVIKTAESQTLTGGTGIDISNSDIPPKDESKLPSRESAKVGDLLVVSSQPSEPNCIDAEVVLSQSEGEPGKFRDCRSSCLVPKHSQNEMSPIGKEMRDHVDGVMSLEPKVKQGRKGGRPPKKNRIPKTQEEQRVSCPQEVEAVQSFDPTQENRASEKKDLVTFEQSKKNSESADKKGTQFDSNACQSQPSAHLPCAGSKPVIPSTVKPQKKVGRPRKTFTNIGTAETVGVGGQDSSASVKESEKNLKALSGKKLLEMTVSAEKQKRGRGRHAEKSVSVVPPQEHVVGTVLEKNVVHAAEMVSSPKKPGPTQKLLGAMQMTDDKESSEWDLKATAPSLVIPLPPTQKKRGRQKKISLTENSFEQKSSSVPHQVQQVLLPSAIKAEHEGMSGTSSIYGNVKEALKTVEEMAVFGEHKDAGKEIVGLKTSAVGLKLKRKIGRPLKKKTLIKMAKQLALAQVGRTNSTENYVGKQPETYTFQENISLRKNYKVKRERKKEELWSPVTQLRRYNRACKTVTDYSVEKLKHRPTDSHHRPLSPSLSGVADPHLISENQASMSSVVLSVPKKGTETTEHDHDRQLPQKKRTPLKNKRKHQEVNIKVEEKTEFSDFTKIQNSSAFEEILPVLKRETVSESVHSSGNSQILKKENKARKGNRLKIKVETGQSSSNLTLPQLHGDAAAPQEKIPLLVPKDELGGTASGTDVVRGKVPHKCENSDVSGISRHAVTLKKVQGNVETPQKKARVSAHIKCEPTQELSSKNVTPKIGALNKCLSPSAIKGPRRRGRPRKNAVVIQPVKSEHNEGIVHYESVADQNYSVSQECPLQPLEKTVSHLNVSANITIKKPRKVDKRRKKFRNLKAQALKGLTEEVVKHSESVERVTSHIADRQEVNRCSQKLETSVLQNSSEESKVPKEAHTFHTLFLKDTGMTPSVQQIVECNDADTLSQQPKKAISSRKRRRRKRSWWDDRGKAKDILTGTDVTTLETPLLSTKDKAEVKKKTNVGKKMTAEQQSGTAYQRSLQNPDEVLSATNALPQGPEKDNGKILEAGESSDKSSLCSALSGEETSSEILCGYQGNAEFQKDPCLEEMESRQFPDNISKNQRQFSNPETGKEKLLAMNAGTPLELCRKMSDTECADDFQETQISKETTSAPLSVPDVEKLGMILDADKQDATQQLIADPCRRKPGRPRKEDQQKQTLANEGKVITEEDTVILKPTETEISDTADVDILVSTESETPNATNMKSTDKISEEGCSEVLPNSSDVEITQEVSSQHQVPNEKEFGKYGDESEQSDQEVEGTEGNHIDEDLVEDMKEELPETVYSSKPRGPGRPPKFKGKKPVECHFCGRSFHHISAYIIHRRIHTGERPYSCQECGKTFAQLSNLNTHRKIHKVPGGLRCPYCSSIFSNQDELYAHCQMHTQEAKQPSLTKQGGNKEVGTESQPPVDLASSSTNLNDGKPHKCSVCGKGFRYGSMLKIHMRVHSGEKPYSCKVCGKAFSQACSVRVHEKIHWSVKPYVCAMCGKGFSQLGTLRTHFHTHMGECQDVVKQVNATITFQCRICNKSFGHWQQYNLHLRTHIDIQHYVCDICGQKFSQSSDLSVHRQSCRKQSLEEVAGSAPVSQAWQKPHIQKDEPQLQLVQPSQIQSYQQYQPQAHQETLPSKYHQSQHQVYELTQRDTRQLSVNPHQGNPSNQAMPKRYQSSPNNPRQLVSPTIQPSETTLRSPLQHHTSRRCFSQSLRLSRKSDPRKYLCPRCGRLFRHLGRLRAHMLTHVRGRSYTCGRCGKTLENWNKFWLHQRVHRQKRGRFFCPKCGQGFRFAGMYKEHLLEHKEQKSFSCPSCPLTYCNYESLRAHQRDVHKACKPQKCNICEKSFFQQGNLEQHILKHHPTCQEYCPHCSLSFPHFRALQEHLKTHANPQSILPEASSQPVLPYQCGECDTTFKTLDLLFSHQLCHSPPRDRKPWRNGEIVGQVTDTIQLEHQFRLKSRSTLPPMAVLPFQPGFSPAHSPQKKNPYVFSPTTPVPQVSPSRTNPADHQDGPRVSHPDASQRANNKPGHLCNLQSLENHTRLPQTLSPSTAVPFSEPQPVDLPSHLQISTSVQLPTSTSVQSSPNPQIEQQRLSQRPLRTYEKSMRGVPKAPSSACNPPDEEDSRDSLECAECGEQFSFVPELYEHYLQHARGEV